MKKFNLMLLGAAAMVMASCSQEDVTAPASDGNFNVTVKLPADQAGTRALGTGLVADNLQIAVYDVSNDQAPKLVTTQRANFNYSLETTVSFSLANGKSYKIAFFAQSGISETQTDGKQAYFFDPDNRKIVADYSAMTSDGNLGDAYDCFYNLYETGKITPSSTGATVILYRPVAQINWGTNDYEEVSIADENAFGQNGQYVQTTMTTKAYTEWDMIANNVVDTSLKDVELTWSDFAAPTAETFPVEGYDYVAMQYVFAPKPTSAVYDLNLNISNGLNPNANVITNDDVFVDNAPVQANYRTNIYGSLLTNPNVFVVVKDPNWNTPDYDVNLAWDGETVTYPTDNGDGTYTIYSASDVAGLAEMVKTDDMEGKTFMLAADLNFNGNEFPGIGTLDCNAPGNSFYISGYSFKGTFDGQNHTISNVTINYTATPGSSAAAFIPYLNGGTVKDVNFSNLKITGEANQAGVIGIVTNGGTVSNVNVGGLVNGRESVGGVAGAIYYEGTIENCTNSAYITSSYRNVGGIVGNATYDNEANKMVIKDCDNTGAVKGVWQVGGIVGTSGAVISGCTNTGAVTATNNSVGGIAGEQRSTGSVTGCENTGKVSAPGSMGVGGIVGWIRYYGEQEGFAALSPITVSGNTNSAAVTGKDSVGGVVGRWSNGGTCTANENSGVVSGDYIAGIIGRTAPDTANADITNELSITGNTNTGTFNGTHAYTIVNLLNNNVTATVSGNNPENAPVAE